MVRTIIDFLLGAPLSRAVNIGNLFPLLFSQGAFRRQTSAISAKRSRNYLVIPVRLIGASFFPTRQASELARISAFGCTEM